jgi:hypothetical protein
MKQARGKTVALVDPLWIGHHPMYFNQFTGSFLRAGARVIGLCPQPDAAMENLRSSVTTEDREQRVRMFNLPSGKRSFFNGRFEGDPARTLDRWCRAAACLEHAEAATGWRADLVYFPYLDSYLRFLPVPLVPDLVLKRPWSGLYLRNHHHGGRATPAGFLRLLAKGDAILRSRNCLGVGVLDERFIPAMERFTGKQVSAYPDVTEGGLPAQETTLAAEVRRKAAGRPIVGIIGLERRKGFLNMLRVADLARREGSPLFFACAGAWFPGEYTESERAEIDALAAGAASGEIDNLHFDPAAGRIASEADFNSLFSTFDVAWAAYENFQGSSGTLSKAALFEIPCIASAGECIGRRVEHYRMGITIPEGSVPHAHEAILRLAALTGADGAPLNPDFGSYRADHSLARLDRILADLLEMR